MAPIRVEFPNVASLRAAVDAVARANEATGTPDDASTAIFHAERVLDAELMFQEQKEVHNGLYRHA